MNIIKQDKNVLIEDLFDFDLTQTLECGQCFRYNKVKENHYIIIAKNKLLELEQKGQNLIFYHTSLTDFNQIWRKYFDLDTNYSEIKEQLIQNDPLMKEIINRGAGIRILNQDFVEILISFIISQNKQIPQIKQVVSNICRKYGDFIATYNDNDYYAFPSVEQLSRITETEFRECKAGFRAKYLIDACRKLSDGTIKEVELHKLSASEIRKELCLIHGVGTKVANCVLLYGLHQKESFPIDVWIKRIMENLYFKNETKLDIIQAFAEEKFGIYGGYAQQYLFYYSRG